jgi:hypothetical protein
MRYSFSTAHRGVAEQSSPARHSTAQLIESLARWYGTLLAAGCWLHARTLPSPQCISTLC